MAKPRNQKLILTTGMLLGRLTIGELVKDIRHHPLFVETPFGYVSQGKLRECQCVCGKTKLLSEAILRTGRIQSCGCLRAEVLEGRNREKNQNLRDAQDRKYIISQIKLEQRILKAHQMADSRVRDEKTIQDTAAKIRNLYTAKNLIRRRHAKGGE
jgi:hypothetical protein